jgi:hypothetical protein
LPFLFIHEFLCNFKGVIHNVREVATDGFCHGNTKAVAFFARSSYSRWWTKGVFAHRRNGWSHSCCWVCCYCFPCVSISAPRTRFVASFRRF